MVQSCKKQMISLPCYSQGNKRSWSLNNTTISLKNQTPKPSSSYLWLVFHYTVRLVLPLWNNQGSRSLSSNVEYGRKSSILLLLCVSVFRICLWVNEDTYIMAQITFSNREWETTIVLLPLADNFRMQIRCKFCYSSMWK